MPSISGGYPPRPPLLAGIKLRCTLGNFLLGLFSRCGGKALNPPSSPRMQVSLENPGEPVSAVVLRSERLILDTNQFWHDCVPFPEPDIFVFRLSICIMTRNKLLTAYTRGL